MSDSLAEKLFEMKLNQIYDKYDWLQEQISFKEFAALFPLRYKNGKAVNLDKPAFDLDREIFLEVLVAFKQSF